MAAIDGKGGRADRLANMSLRSKLLLAFGTFLALLVVACVMFLLAQQRQQEARGWTTHTYTVLNRIEAALRSLRERQVSVRGYVMSSRESELDLYRSAAADYHAINDELLAMTADNPAQQARLIGIGQNVEEWQKQVADPTIDAVRKAQSAGPQKQALIDQAALRYLDGVGGTLRGVYALYDEMRDAEQALLKSRQESLDRASRLTTVLICVVLVFGFAVVVVSLIAAQRLVTQPILDLSELMTRLAGHDHDIVVPMQQRSDEVGEIARALEVFKRMAIETFEQNWVRTGTATLSNLLQRTSTREEFGRALVAEAAPLVKAAAAAFHRFDESSGRLERIGDYAPDAARLRTAGAVALGEGLVGQCAVERKPIVVTDLPDGYLQIGSGLGASPPRTLVLLPVLLQERLVGVLELALFGRFETLHQRLFEDLLPIVGLSLDNLQRAIRTQTLLEETQTQSEELRASEESLRVQQEELRATNDQLIAQRAQLQASEEELKVQAEELQAANEELTEKSETLTQQKKVLESLQRETLAKADELARASQYKSDFLANMSHELRTPLNSLLILSRSLADNDAGHLDAEEVESAHIIHESGANLLRLINDILDLSKVEAGKIELVLDRLEPAEFAQRLGRTFRPVAREKGLELSIEVDPSMPAALRTDGARLEQIANNLIGNAFKFTRQGRVEVRLSRPAPETALPAGLDRASAIALSIRDTGIGIPADKLGRLFQAFEQVDAGTSRQFGGTGLGLAISRRLAQLLGGDITLASTEGQGSLFTVLIPEQAPEGAAAPATLPAPPPRPTVARPAAQSPKATPPPVAAASTAPAFVPAAVPSIVDDRETIAAGDTVILIVEDDPAFARILADLVRRKHYKVLAAADGESGLALARQYKPTGVLLDVMLPGMDGWTVIDKLKADTATRHIPVHFISATDEQARALDAGAVGFLTKPVSRQDVGNAFDRLLHFAPGATRRVLIVDDDTASRHAVRVLIADDSVEIVESDSAEDALVKLAAQRFDCVVLDLGLPGMSGFEFLERASQNGQVPPVVVHSGKDLSREDNLKLRQYTDSIVIKGARSPDRLLDEVTLFLHSIRRESKSTGTAPPRALDPKLANRTVLIVDDDMRNIFALSKALRARGLKVLMAQDGQKALKQLADNRNIDIVLMDIMMPGMDGYETTREIRRQPLLRNLPVLALTAKAMQGDREKCLEAGANDYLSKPIDIDKLLSMMRVWVS